MIVRSLLPALLLCLGWLGGSACAQKVEPARPGPEELRAASALAAAAQALEEAVGFAERGEAEAFRLATTRAAEAFDRAQAELGIAGAARRRLRSWTPRGDMELSRRTLGESARLLAAAAGAFQEGRRDQAIGKMEAGFEAVEKAKNQDALVTDPFQVLAILLATLALLFGMNRHPRLGRLFKVIPLLVFAYFVPTILSNTGLIPLASPLYTFIKKILLPASLVLLVLAVDIKGILRLGRHAVLLFLFATFTIVIGGPIAYLICHPLVPAELGDQVWRGLAALSGSWIGGGANFVAIGESAGATATTISLMVVVDVAVANVWMAVLLFFAGRERRMDERIGAERGAIDEVRRRVEDFEERVKRPTNLADLLIMLAIAFGATAIATALARILPPVGDIIREFTWVVLIVTTVALLLSFTRARELEGAGASAVGSVLLYLLVASIGAHAEFAKVVEVPSLVLVGAVWMFIHALLMLLLRRFLKAPVFFLAVGSQANVGGAASAPIVASAFHPALAPVGVLLAVGGYVLGTYAGLVCAFLLEQVHTLMG